MKQKFLAITLILTISLMFNFSEQVDAQPPLIVTVYSDKAVYAPGDDVNIKVEVREADASRVTGANVDIGIISADGAYFGFIATETGIQMGDYFYTYHLDPGSQSGVWTITSGAQKVGFLDGSDTIAFQVTSGPGPGPAFDFSLALSPSSLTVEAGQDATFKVLLSYSDPSFSGTVVTIQLTGLGPGMTYQLSGIGDLIIFTTSSAPAGTYPINVIGSANGVIHQTSGILIVQEQAAPFEYSVSISPTTRTLSLGDTGSFAVTVTLTSGNPEIVSLSLNGLPGDIQHTFSQASGNPTFTSTLTVDSSGSTSTGTYTFTVNANAASQVKTTTATLTVEEEADFSITASPVSKEINLGDSTTFMLNINEVGGFDQSVSLTAVGLPSGASPSFSPASGKPVFTSTLTISTTESTPTGSFTVTIDASGGGKTRSATVTLTIKEQPQEAVATTTQTTASGESSEKSTLESNLSTLLSNPIYLLIIIIVILAVSLGAIALKRGRAPTPTQPRPQAPTGYCVKCGSPLKPGTTFCHSCGQQVE